MLRVRHPHGQLACDQWLDPPSPVTRLLLQFPHCGIGGRFIPINQAARQLPAPPILNEPMSPHKQHALSVIYHDQRDGTHQPHSRPPDPLTTRHPDVNLAHPDRRILEDRPFSEDPPALFHAIPPVNHAPDASGSPVFPAT